MNVKFKAVKLKIAATFKKQKCYNVEINLDYLLQNVNQIRRYKS